MRLCDWCRTTALTDPRARFCNQRCRQAAFRLRLHTRELERASKPLRLAYADPPYPGTAKRYYQHEPSYQGEVDHAKLIASLTTSFDGWALSTSAKALRELLPLCPERARLCVWAKPHPPAKETLGIHNCWEAVIVVSGRRRRGGVRDWISALPARGGGTLPGRKPLAFCAWLFELLGAEAGDEFVDLFPGTGIVSAAWRELSSNAGNASPSGPGDALRPGTDDASFSPTRFRRESSRSD